MDINTLPPSPYAVDYPFRPPTLAADILSMQSTGRRRKGRHAKPRSVRREEFFFA